jgi:hypothetical protein
MAAGCGGTWICCCHWRSAGIFKGAKAKGDQEGQSTEDAEETGVPATIDIMVLRIVCATQLCKQFADSCKMNDFAGSSAF